MKNNSVYKNFGNMLSILRVEKGLTRNEVSEKLGVAKNTYGQYERGERRVPLNHVLTLSKLLNFDVNEFVESQKIENEENLQKNQEMKWLVDFKKLWLEEVGNLEPTHREMSEILKYAKYILSKRNEK